jgi:DNA-binding NarL/FixJ family response regulator
VSERRPTVLLADDHPMMAEGVRKLLEPEFEVVEVVRDGRALLAAAGAHRPDLVITDISMPELDGLEAARQLRSLYPEMRVLVLSIHAESSWVQAAFEAGAHAYLCKTSAPEEIETAVREVLKGLFYVSPAVTRGLVGPARLEKTLTRRREARPAASVEALTPRELDIVRLVGKGLGNKRIAHELGVSVTTVRTHLNRVYDKLEPGSRLELALYAAQARPVTM